MPKAETSKAVAARRRNRKRKRRVASSESSSSSSSSSGSSDGEVALKIQKPITKPRSSSSSSSDSSDSESDIDDRVKPHVSALPVKEQVPAPQDGRPSVQPRTRRSPSLTPPPAPIPSFLPSKTSPDPVSGHQDEQVLKDRFRKFWMASVADGFKDDLEQIRKEPGLTTSRLAMLIDSLASGADVYNSSAAAGSSGVNEMGVVLDS